MKGWFEKMKKVLWISRHRMTDVQFTDLQRIMQEEVWLVVYDQTVAKVEQLIPILPQVDAIAAVLPIELLAQLFKYSGEKMLLQAVSERKPTGRMVDCYDGRKEQEFAFVHAGWKQICKLELETKIL